MLLFGEVRLSWELLTAGVPGETEPRGFLRHLLQISVWVSSSHAGPRNALTRVLVGSQKYEVVVLAGSWSVWPANAVQFERCCCMIHPSSIQKCYK